MVLLEQGIIAEVCPKASSGNDDRAVLLKHLAVLFVQRPQKIRVEANDGNNTGNGKFAHLAASSRT